MSHTDRFGIKKLYKSKDGGRRWYSTSWNNGKVREIEHQWDPYDSKLGVISGNLRINGNGTATAAPKTTTLTRGQRTYVNGPWRNTEITVYVKIRGQCGSVQLRSRSNHFGVHDLPYGMITCGDEETNCGFGNYLVKWSDDNDNKVMVEVEAMHPFYKRAINKHDSILPLGKWTGFKQVTRDIGSKVKVEGYILRDTKTQDWKKDVEFLFDGTNAKVVVEDYDKPCLAPCIDKGDKVANDLDKNTVWQHSGKWCWLRFEGLDKGVWDIDLKYFSVREII